MSQLRVESSYRGSRHIELYIRADAQITGPQTASEPHLIAVSNYLFSAFVLVG